MILKEFQKRALATVEEYLERLAEWRSRAAAVLEVDPEMDFDWTARAWEKGRALAPVPAAPERAGRAAAVVLSQGPHRRRQDAACDQGDRPRQHPLPAAADGAGAVDRPDHADLRPDPEGAEGSRPPVPAAARSGVRRPDPGAGEDQRVRPAGRCRPPVRADADAAVGQPGDEGAASDVPGQRRLRALLPGGRRRGGPRIVAGGHPEPRHVRAGGRLLDPAREDLPRQHAAAPATADHPRRRAQGVQREREGDARRIQPLHDRRAVGDAAPGRERARRRPGPTS